MYRLFFHEPLPARMTPMLFILLAPPSVGFISYIGMVGELDVFARIIYYMALFLGLLLAMNIFRFLKVPFFISSWAYSFPLAALTIATMKMTHLTSYIRDSAANLGINCFIQNTKKLKQPSLMLLNTRYEALAAKFECVDTFEF